MIPGTIGYYFPASLGILQWVDHISFTEGASVDVRDYSGKRPKDYLRRNAMPSIKDKLQRKNSSMSIKIDLGITLF